MDVEAVGSGGALVRNNDGTLHELPSFSLKLCSFETNVCLEEPF